MPGGMLSLGLCSLSEAEARKACEWLRAAGFPQYAQLYEGESCLFCCSPSLPCISARFQGGCGESSQSAGRGEGCL